MHDRVKRSFYGSARSGCESARSLARDLFPRRTARGQNTPANTAAPGPLAIGSPEKLLRARNGIQEVSRLRQGLSTSKNCWETGKMGCVNCTGPVELVESETIRPTVVQLTKSGDASNL